MQDNEYILSYPVVQEMQRQLGASAELAAVGSISRVYATFTDRPEGVQALTVSANFFDLLGVRPAVGRLFGAAEAGEIGASPVVVISDRYWQRRFGGDRAVLNSRVRINGFPVTIFLPSTFLRDVPMILKSAISFVVTSAGIVRVAAIDAISPYPAFLPDDL